MALALLYKNLILSFSKMAQQHHYLWRACWNVQTALNYWLSGLGNLIKQNQEVKSDNTKFHINFMGNRI